MVRSFTSVSQMLGEFRAYAGINSSQSYTEAKAKRIKDPYKEAETAAWKASRAAHRSGKPEDHHKAATLHNKASMLAQDARHGVLTNIHHISRTVPPDQRTGHAEWQHHHAVHKHLDNRIHHHNAYAASHMQHAEVAQQEAEAKAAEAEKVKAKAVSKPKPKKK